MNVIPELTWETRTVNTSDLKPAKYNPRTISDHDKKALKRSLTEFGHAYPVICNTDLTVVGGHQTLEAAKELGWETIKVNVPSRTLSDTECKTLNLALNRIHGDWSDDLLPSLLKELYDGDADLELTGFTDQEINDLIEGLYDEHWDKVPEGDKIHLLTG